MFKPWEKVLILSVTAIAMSAVGGSSLARALEEEDEDFECEMSLTEDCGEEEGCPAELKHVASGRVYHLHQVNCYHHVEEETFDEKNYWAVMNCTKNSEGKYTGKHQWYSCIV
jgi:hypothetical protein